MKIFTPKDAKEHKLASIPDFVYQAFNNLLAKNYDAYSTVILQGEVITEIIRLCPSDDITVQTIWENKWLDVEDEYRKMVGKSNMTSQVLVRATLPDSFSSQKKNRLSL